MTTHERWMRRALREAQDAAKAGEIPVGAIVVRGETLLGCGRNSIIAGNDPTAHAEMLAITAATQVSDSPWLEGCTMYVTLEPCTMCAGAIVLARLERVVFAAPDGKTGACGSLYNIPVDQRLNHRAEIIGGVLEAESMELLQTFFQKLRRAKETIEPHEHGFSSEV